MLYIPYEVLHVCQAWQLCDPDAKYVFEALRKAGVKTAVVSNFDTRLRPLLQALNCDHWFDAVAVSAEVGFHFQMNRLAWPNVQALAGP